MKKNYLLLLLISLLIIGCGNKSSESIKNNVSDSVAKTEVDTNESSTEDAEDSEKKISAIGEVDVDKGIFNVTLTIPKDFIGEVTQDEIDEAVKDKGYKSATLNSDGSVTYVMTKAQHKDLMKEITESINTNLLDMVGTEDYPNITDVKANDDFSIFTITTKNEEPDMAESFSVIGLYMYGAMYKVFNGENVGNIHVDFVNAESQEIISSLNSDDMKAD